MLEWQRWGTSISNQEGTAPGILTTGRRIPGGAGAHRKVGKVWGKAWEDSEVLWPVYEFLLAKLTHAFVLPSISCLLYPLVIIIFLWKQMGYKLKVILSCITSRLHQTLCEKQFHTQTHTSSLPRLTPLDSSQVWIWVCWPTLSEPMDLRTQVDFVLIVSGGSRYSSSEGWQDSDLEFLEDRFVDGLEIIAQLSDSVKTFQSAAS